MGMPLSDHEQRILDEIARNLAEEDPRFAATVRSATPRGHALRRLRLAAFGGVAGLALFGTGLFLGEGNVITFGFAGFLVMLVSTLAGVRASRALGSAVVIEARQKREQREPRKGFRERMDERWQRRMDGDGR
jgi:hypothetical protein